MENIYDIIEKDERIFNDKEFIFECKENMEYIKQNFNSITYGQFINKAKNFASQLNEKEYTNQNILLIGKNSISYMLVDFAITMYVGKCVNIDMTTPLLEIEHLVDFYNISLVIYGNELSEVFNNFNKCDKINLSTINFEENIDSYILFKNNLDECHKIIFSSGSTSSPKGVMLSLKNIFAGWESLQRRTPFTENDVIYLCLPLNHTYANIYNFYYSFLSGLSIYLSSNMINIIKEMTVVQPSIFCGVPLIYKRLSADLLELSKISSLKYLYCGGAKLDVDLKQLYYKYNLRLLNAYALTETASSFAIDYPDNDIEDTSVGTIFEDLDVKIIKEKNGIGDIVVKGDAVFLGYYNNKIVTKNSFTYEGYFITNDKGYIKDNKLYIVGRNDNRITQSNGENIYVDEIRKWFKSKNENILDVNIYERNGKNIYLFYVNKIDENKLNELVKEFNSSTNKKDKIFKYEIKYKREKLIV